MVGSSFNGRPGDVPASLPRPRRGHPGAGVAIPAPPARAGAAERVHSGARSRHNVGMSARAASPRSIAERGHGRDRGHRIAAASLLVLLGVALLAGSAGPLWGQGAATVLRTDVTGAISPVTARHLDDAIATAADEGHEALVVEMNTPGGLADVTLEITSRFLNAPVPVIVYVSPSGSRAASAGAFITAASHVAAMAPGTHIGAATPVSMGGGEMPEEQLEKIISDSAAQISAIAEERDRDVDFYVETVRDGRSEPASVALEVGAVDLIAESLPQLLREIDGTTVEVGGGDEVTLATAGATPVDYEMSMVRQLLQSLANPQVALTLLSIGTLALIYELANPGAIIPGVVGAVMLLLGLFSLNQLPVNIVGVLLLVIALGLFVAELFVPGVGVFAGGGALALVAAGMFLFDAPTGIGLDLTFLVPVALAVALVVIVVGRITWRSLRLHRYRGPTGEYRGTVTEVRDVDEQGAWVWYEGSRWRAKRADGGALELGQQVRVQRIDGLTVYVEPAEDTEPTTTA